MIKEVDGDILEYPLDIILAGCNCQKTFGAGLNLAIKKKYPEAYQADLDFPFSPEDRLGSFSHVETHDGKKIVNCYSQLNYGYGKQISYDAIDQCFEAISSVCRKKQYNETKRIGIPAGFGSVRGGGDWRVIQSLIDVHFGEFEEFYIVNKDFKSVEKAP